MSPVRCRIGIDQVHCFALPCRCEELAITGGGEAQSPELGHRQPGLRLDDRGQGPVIASLSICQRDRRVSSQYSWVLEASAILFRPRLMPSASSTFSRPMRSLHAPRAQMGERVGEADCLIHFQQEVGDPDFWQASVQIQDQLISVSRRVGRNPVGSHDAVLDAGAWQHAHSCRGWRAASTRPACVSSVGQPVFRETGDGQCGGCGDDLGGHEGHFQIGVTPGMTQPDVSGAKRVAQMEQHGDLPQAPIVTLGGEEAAATSISAVQSRWNGFAYLPGPR